MIQHVVGGDLCFGNATFLKHLKILLTFCNGCMQYEDPIEKCENKTYYLGGKKMILSRTYLFDKIISIGLDDLPI